MNTNETGTIQYLFSDYELKQLVLYFRKKSDVPKSLENLMDFSENYVYGTMTIEEAETFFKN